MENGCCCKGRVIDVLAQRTQERKGCGETTSRVQVNEWSQQRFCIAPKLAQKLLSLAPY